jgi:NADH:ubiquinone oxidoreductase subunit D
MDAFLTRSDIVEARCQGVGVLTREQAVNFSASGPVLRASGVPYDIRRASPYSIYDRFKFDVPVFPNGDVYDRYRQRIAEMRQSLAILDQAIGQIPESGPVIDKKLYLLRPPEGEIYSRCENPKGELGFYFVSDGGMSPYRYHIRSPSFINLTALDSMCRGHLIADAILILGSLDIVMGEVDR